ncbi:MAG: LytR/AlgR family response regulator transcription factor [Salibacteraceae bacterium]
MKTNYRAILVDDEHKSRLNLNLLLQNFCPHIEVVAECENIQEAKTALNTYRPQLVFLDIKMPGESGFDLLESVQERFFEIIFTTGYDEYAIKAFQYHAIGYLLKPIYSADLVEAVQRATQYMDHAHNRYIELLQDLQRNTVRQTIPLPVEDGLELVNAKDILRLQAEGSYCQVFLKDGRQLLLTKNLKSMEKMLDGEAFFRIHQSHLVNLDEVRKILKTDGGFVLMSEGAELEISRRKKGELLEFLSK